MSDSTSHGSDVQETPAWWMASDQRWYPPELHPDYTAPAATAPPAAAPVAAAPDPAIAAAEAAATANAARGAAARAATGTESLSDRLRAAGADIASNPPPVAAAPAPAPAPSLAEQVATEAEAASAPPVMPGSNASPVMPGSAAPPVMPDSGAPPAMPGSGDSPVMPSPAMPSAGAPPAMPGAPSSSPPAAPPERETVIVSVPGAPAPAPSPEPRATLPPVAPPPVAPPPGAPAPVFNAPEGQQTIAGPGGIIYTAPPEPPDPQDGFAPPAGATVPAFAVPAAAAGPVTESSKSPIAGVAALLGGAAAIAGSFLTWGEDRVEGADGSLRYLREIMGSDTNGYFALGGGIALVLCGVLFMMGVDKQVWWSVGAFIAGGIIVGAVVFSVIDLRDHAERFELPWLASGNAINGDSLMSQQGIGLWLAGAGGVLGVLAAPFVNRD